MTNSMLEQVARAVCANALGCIKRPRCINSDGTNAPCSASVDQLVLSEAWPTALAAIQAMREPSEGMTLEGAKASADQHYYKSNSWERCVNEEFQCDWLNGAKFGWQAMIDEALKE